MDIGERWTLITNDTEGRSSTMDFVKAFHHKMAHKQDLKPKYFPSKTINIIFKQGI